MALALAAALLVNQPLGRLRGVYRVGLFSPTMIPMVAAAMLWVWLFNPGIGLVNHYLGYHGLPRIEWLYDRHWALPAIIIMSIWKHFGYFMLIFLAGLQSIPEDVYEAADVDGATKWQRFMRVTLPLLIPYFTMALILRAIDAFRIFELALVLAGGIEPVLGTYIAGKYLPPANDPFTSASASIVLFGIIMLFIVLYLKFVARFQVQR
jgi:ABC-type sugar transport system permease subunit